MPKRQIFLPGGGGGGSGPNFIAKVKVGVKQSFRLIYGPIGRAVVGFDLKYLFSLRMNQRAGIRTKPRHNHVSLFRNKPGIRVKSRHNHVSLFRNRVGVRVNWRHNHVSLTRQKPGIRTKSRHSHSSLIRQKPAIKTKQRFIVHGNSIPVDAGANIMQVKYDLVRRAGANVVTQDAVGGRNDWTNIANAQGRAGGGSASFAGNLTAARGGRLVFDYVDSLNKTLISITSVKLHFYVTTAGTTLENADVRLQYRLGTGGAVVTLQTLVGNAPNVPKTYDITSDTTWDWAKIDSLQALIRADAAASETWTATADAVELEIVGTYTETL